MSASKLLQKFIGVRIIKEMPDLVASGTHCAILYRFRTNKFIIRRLLLYTQHISFSKYVRDV